jgi:hypothetical protein
MDKKILLELQRMRQIMGYDRGNPNNVLYEQDFEGGDGGVELKEKDISERRWVEVILGPGMEGNPKYPTPIVREKGVPIMGDRETGLPIVWQSNGETAKAFFKNVQTGSVKDVNGKIHENQEYILGADGKTKLCLPDKAFWDIFKKYKLVYKFQNPKNGKIFNLKLDLGDKNNTSAITAEEQSKRCLGANNGWGLDFKNYYEKGTGKAYNTGNTEHFDLRSDEDIFWDEYSLYIELAIGLLASVLAGPLAGALVGIFAEGVLAATWLGRLIVFLNDAKYLTTGVSWLKIICEVSIEAGLLSPYIMNLFERGNDKQAALNLCFCLVPFIIEIPSLQGFIKNGIGGKSNVDSLIQKLDTWGGIERLMAESAGKSEEELAQILSQITTDPIEKEIFYKGFEIIKLTQNGNEKIVQKAFGEFINSQAPAIEKGIINRGMSDTDVMVRDMANFLINSNPTMALTGKGVLPMFLRGALIIGPFALGFNKGWDYIQEKIKEPEDQERVAKIMQEQIKNHPLLKELAVLYEELGINPGGQTNDELIGDIVKQTLDNPEFQVKNDEIIKKLTIEATDEQVKKKLESEKQIIVNTIKKETSKTKTIKTLTRIDKTKTISILEKLISELGGYTEVVFTIENINGFTSPWEFTADGKNGMVVFQNGDNGTYIIKVNDKQIFP